MGNEAYNGPWKRDIEEEEEHARMIEEILCDLGRRGYGVGKETPLMLELVRNVLQLWNYHPRDELNDEPEEWDDDEAGKVYTRLVDEGEWDPIVLDRDGVETIAYTSDEIAIDDFHRHLLEMPDPYGENFKQLGNWAMAKMSKGDMRSALEALAYAQEQEADSELWFTHSQRSSVFERMGNLPRAIAEIRRAVECERRSLGMPHPMTLHNIARLELETGRMEDAIADIRACLESIRKLTCLPLESLGYVKKSDSCADMSVPVVTIASVLKDVIALVEKIEAALPEAAGQLEDIKMRIVELREVIEVKLDA